MASPAVGLPPLILFLHSAPFTLARARPAPSLSCIPSSLPLLTSRSPSNVDRPPSSAPPRHSLISPKPTTHRLLPLYLPRPHLIVVVVISLSASSTRAALLLLPQAPDDGTHPAPSTSSADPRYARSAPALSPSDNSKIPMPLSGISPPLSSLRAAAQQPVLVRTEPRVPVSSSSSPFSVHHAHADFLSRWTTPSSLCSLSSHGAMHMGDTPPLRAAPRRRRHLS